MKVVKAGTDTTYTAKASHILIRWEDETPAKKKIAKEKAVKIIRDIKAGADLQPRRGSSGQMDPLLAAAT